MAAVAAVVASIAGAAAGSMAAEAITAEAMATTARVRAAGGMSTASASAGGDIGLIAVTLRRSAEKFRRVGKTGTPFSFDLFRRDERRPRSRTRSHTH